MNEGPREAAADSGREDSAAKDRAPMTPAGGAPEEAPHDGRASGAPPPSASAIRRHKDLMERMKLLPIFWCGYCGLPHPTRYCPGVDLGRFAALAGDTP